VGVRLGCGFQAVLGREVAGRGGVEESLLTRRDWGGLVEGERRNRRHGSHSERLHEVAASLGVGNGFDRAGDFVARFGC
jgi:hypothetical protein